MDWKIADAALSYIVWSISRLRISMKADVKKVVITVLLWERMEQELWTDRHTGERKNKRLDKQKNH